MEDDEQETELIVDSHIDFPTSDRFVRIRIRRVPESDAYPEGVKYSMHYGNYDGTTILRYDNAHEKTKGHERHTPQHTEEIRFNGWLNHLQQFQQEVIEHEREINK